MFQVEHDMALLGEEKKELDDKKLVHDAQVKSDGSSTNILLQRWLKQKC
jgi:hypothetical protein